MASTILVSIITSLIVSVIVFILGLRAGKNQTDRPKLKEIYRRLSVHFQDLLYHIQLGKPKRREHFQRKRIFYAETPVIEIREKGLDIDLSQRVVKNIDQLENECITFGYSYLNALQKVLDLAISRLRDHSISPPNEKKQSIKSGQPGTFFEVNFGILLVHEELLRICTRLNEDQNLGIRLQISRKNTDFSFCVNANSLKDVNISEFLLAIHQTSINLPDVVEVLAEKKRLVTSLQTKIKRLNQRTRDPHSFWETLIGAFGDLFKI